MEAVIKKAIATTGNSKYATVCKSRMHAVIVDEPAENDGADTGPTPSELLCMSLAACVSITLKMYATRKQWDTGEIYVQVTLQRMEDKSVFVKELSFEKNLDEDAKQRLLLIADKCPVHKILNMPTEFQTLLAK